MSQAELADLAAAVRETLGLRLDGYRPSQLERRLSFFRQRHGLGSNAELAARLRADPELRRRFADFLTINVSEFFRNPDRFAELRDRHLPALLARKPALRVWSAGCSIGAEIYSVALLLRELAPGQRHELLGTDIDETALARARAGVYGPADLRSLPEAMRRRYFRETPAGWELDPAVRAAVRFARHDLLKDPYPQGWDLILCRNVVIYFTDEAKAEVWRRLAASLADGGVLFVGGSESLYGLRDVGLRYVSPCFYEKAPGPAGPPGGMPGRPGRGRPGERTPSGMAAGEGPGVDGLPSAARTAGWRGGRGGAAMSERWHVIVPYEGAAACSRFAGRRPTTSWPLPDCSPSWAETP